MRLTLKPRTCLLWIAFSLLSGAGVALVLYAWLDDENTALPLPTIIRLRDPRVSVATVAVTATRSLLAPDPNRAPWSASLGTHLAAIPENPDPVLDRAVRLGVTWVGLDFDWGEWQYFENSPEDWSDRDRVMASARQHGLRVLVRLHGAPAWTNAAGSTTAPPDDYRRYAAFAGRLAGRYPDILGALEVWYHQNLPERWSTPEGPSPQAYSRLLDQTAQAVHAVRPDVQVISGALAEGPGEGDYLAGFAAAGGPGRADCLGVESLGAPGAAVRDLRERLEGYRQFGPVCLTGLGYPAALEGLAPAGLDWSRQVTESARAKYLASALSGLGNGEWPEVRLAIIWNLDYAPASGNPGHPAAPYSLLNLAGEPREAYWRVQEMLRAYP